MILYLVFIFKDLAKEENDFLVNPSVIQEQYDKAIFNFNLNSTKCRHCGRIGDFSIHGYYKRSIIISGMKYSLIVQRVICHGCDRTHAIFTADMIPYCRYLSFECMLLILKKTTFFDPSEIKNIKARFNTFLQRCNGFNIKLVGQDILNIDRITIPLIQFSFLQIRKGMIFTPG